MTRNPRFSRGKGERKVKLIERLEFIHNLVLQKDLPFMTHDQIFRAIDAVAMGALSNPKEEKGK